MKKGITISLIIVLSAVLLLSLPCLYVWVQGTIIASFEWFPREDDIAVGRVVYATILVFTIAIDAILCIGLVKLIKELRTY